MTRAYSASARFARVERLFGTVATGSTTSRLASRDTASLAIISARTGATFMPPSRARTSGVRPG
jgi:hypothetical protein